MLEHSSASLAFSEYQTMLAHAARYLPKGAKVILLAERGFVHAEAMSAVRRLGWHYRIRLKGNTWLWRSSGGWMQPNTVHLARGEVRCFHHLKLHKQQCYSPVHVIFGGNNLNGQLWAVVSDKPTSIQTFREYALRFDIEELFKDEHSGGWNLQKSEIRSLCDLPYPNPKLSHLVFELHS